MDEIKETTTMKLMFEIASLLLIASTGCIAILQNGVYLLELKDLNSSKRCIEKKIVIRR